MEPSPDDQQKPDGRDEGGSGQGGGEELLQRAAEDFLCSGLALLIG